MPFPCRPDQVTGQCPYAARENARTAAPAVTAKVRLHRLGVVLFSIFLQSCADLRSSSLLPPAIDPADAIPAQRFDFDDGGHALYYLLDKALSNAYSPRPATFMFFIGGSGCTSMHYFLPRYFRGLDGASGPIRIFSLQKRFITERSWGRLLGCSPEFIRADHPSRWVADQIAFINAQLDRARAANRMPKRIVIAGVSEGAEIVPVLANTIPGVTHVVMIGNGGMPPLHAYRLQLERNGLDASAVLDTVVPIPTDPDAPGSGWGGRSWRYWNELRDIDNLQQLLSLPMPIWVAMGERDQAVPVASAYHLQQQFDAHGKTNLVLKIYPGADHGLSTNSRANTPDLWFQFDNAMGK